MSFYSLWSLLRHSCTGHGNWSRAWRSPSLRSSYDIIIVGGGGHGLASAYYLAEEFGVRNVAVIEKGWLGGGNTGRNTTIVRSGYLQDASALMYQHGLELFSRLSSKLNFNVMFSARGVLQLAHSVHDLQEQSRRAGACRLNGIDIELLSVDRVKDMLPEINLHGRFPVMGAAYQSDAGNARHDGVAWGYARAADRLGVDIIQNCEVRDMLIRDGKIEGLVTSLGDVRCGRVGVVASGHSSVLAAMGGFRLPMTSVALQALVSEPIKPVLDKVVMSNGVHVYLSQSDKGELVIGAGADQYSSYSQRGSFASMDEILSPLVELFPYISGLRMLRQWGGVVDITPDRSPILSRTPVEGLYFNCGWGTGGFKATAGSGHVFASSLAGDEMHPIAAPFSLDRFYSGLVIDEGSAAGVAH